MKKYIRAMSTPRNQAIDTLDYYSLDLMEHVIKIVMYHDIRKGDVPHWISEIATWLNKCDSITLKPNNKRLKAKEIETHLFGWMGTSLNDYDRALYRFLHDNEKGKFNYADKTSYPDFEITEDSVRLLQDICYDIINNTIPMLVDKEDHSKDEYVEVLNKIFFKIL